MGFVPARQFEKLKGELGRTTLSILIPSDTEDTWFFTRQWLRENKWVDVKEVEKGGCVLRVNRLIDTRQAASTIIKNLVVNITAQGLVMICATATGNDLTALNLLRIAAGREVSLEDKLLLTFE